jgi:hypothetical protein
MKKLMLVLALAAMPMAAFADTPAKTTKKHKAHKTAASPAPEASPAAGTTSTGTTKAPATKASPAPKASPSPAAK